MIVSTQASRPLEDIAAAAQQAAHVCGFNSTSSPTATSRAALVRRAEATGYRGPGGDGRCAGQRHAQSRTARRLSPAAGRRCSQSAWHASAIRRGRRSAACCCSAARCSRPRRNGRTSPGCGRITALPIMLKGMMTPEDAELAVEQASTASSCPTTAAARSDHEPATHRCVAADLRQRSAASVPVLIDGGIRRGSDVFKALALGAKAVLIGRP